MLAEMQRAFARDILAGDDAGDAIAWIAGDRRAAQVRFDIHRNNTYASLASVLRAAFPVICRLVGQRHFNFGAREFIRSYPPRIPVLANYGENFGSFLETFEPARGAPYLPDLARLEWARNVALFAEDAPPLAPTHFTGLGANYIPALTFALHPAALLVASRYAIQHIWDAAKPERQEVVPFHPDRSPESVLIVRTWLGVEGVVLSPGNFALLSELEAGATLKQAIGTALAVEADFDFEKAFSRHLAQGTFRAFGNHSGIGKD